MDNMKKWLEDESEFNRKALRSVPLDSKEYSNILSNVERIEKMKESKSCKKDSWIKQINPNTVLIFAGTTLHLLLAMGFEKESLLPKAYNMFGQKMKF